MSAPSPWAAALLAIACNYCGAQPGQRCVRPDGTDEGHFHSSRFTQRDRADQTETAIRKAAR